MAYKTCPKSLWMMLNMPEEAMDIYPKMLAASPEEKERIRDGLLKYCCLDTLAMVKVLRKVKECVKD